jgi:hypothetical protein
MSVDGTKFQINYKLSDGTLINLYAKDVKDLETGLVDLGMVATLIKATSNDLNGGAVAPAPTAESVVAQFNAPAINPLDDRRNPQPVAVQSNGSVHTCRHGEMAFRSGTSAKGPWKGYMCAAPKGATDKCDTIWVR